MLPFGCVEVSSESLLSRELLWSAPFYIDVGTLRELKTHTSEPESQPESS